MNRLKLAEAVRGGESEAVEFKKSTGQRTEAARTLCAMANTGGGTVFFGIAPDGSIVGQQVSARTLEDLENELKKLEPMQFPEIRRIRLENSFEVISLSIEKTEKPVLFDGRPYLRKGPTTVVMPVEVLSERVLKSSQSENRWDSKRTDAVRVSDLSHQEIVVTIDESVRRCRAEDPGSRDLKKILTGFGLISEGKLLNAAVTLFGKSEKFLPDFPQCALRMARFRGKSKSEFLDNRYEFGNIFELLLRSQRFLRDHLPVAGRIVPSLFEREDDPMFPPAALREALANAFCHRSYAGTGGVVSVAIFDDRLEISNPGVLPVGMNVEDLARSHASRPPNPLIANVLFRRGIIENWGRGTNKILELTEGAGFARPEFDVTGGEFTVRFFSRHQPAVSGDGTDLSAIQMEILSILTTSGACSLADIVSRVSGPNSIRTVQDNLQVLRRRKLVELIGQSRGSRWILGLSKS